MKTLKNQLDSLYISCMSCPNTEKQCKEILKDYKNGIPPRGFLFKAAPVKLLVVSKNPGHPLNGETKKYIGRMGIDLFEAFRNHQKEVYYHLNKSKDRNLRFHKNLFSYMSYVFKIDPKEGEYDIDKIYQHMAHTSLVKCSTNGEQDKLNPQTMEECFNKYFLDELKLLKPKVLLALGREVENFLNAKKAEFKLPKELKIIYIKHPSYPLGRQNEKRILSDIKKRIAKYSKD